MRRIALSLLFCWLSGCSQWRYELGQDLSAVDVPGQGHELLLKDVLQQLGPPQRLSALNEGYVLAWEHWRIRKSTIGLSLGLMGADLFAIDWGNAQIDGEFLVLTFDTMHRLKGSSFSRWDRESGGGAALQPSLVGMSLVDVGDLLRPLPQHRWGGRALRPMPRVLNTASSPGSGQVGIEQRGTPGGAGQRSLELGD